MSGLTVAAVAPGAAATPSRAAKLAPSHAKAAPLPAGLRRGLPLRYSIVTSQAYANPAGATSGGGVGCPAKTVIYSGGAYSDSASTLVNLTISQPAGNSSWMVWMSNASDQAATFTVYAVCAKRTPSWSSQSNTVITPAHHRTPLTLDCPADTKLLGGGGGGVDVTLQDNLGSLFPTKQAGAFFWRADINNATGTDYGGSVYAQCGSARGYKVLGGPQVPLAPGTQAEAFLACPAPKVPIGGGVYSATDSTAVNINTSYPTSDGWDTFVNNFDGPATTIRAWVICAGTAA